jgi:hypothetical protein
MAEAIIWQSGPFAVCSSCRRINQPVFNAYAMCGRSNQTRVARLHLGVAAGGPFLTSKSGSILASAQELQLRSRHGIEKNEANVRPQPFSLIITIADPDAKAPIYDEMAQVIRNRFQADNLNLRTGVRIRSRN